jgi:outer membrane beta-barrel protein
MMLRKALTGTLKKFKTTYLLGSLALAGSIHSANAAEDDLYDFLWLDQDKQVYVLQNKVFKKKNRFSVNAGYIMGLSSEFQDTSGWHANFGYHFSEQLGVELMYNEYSNTDNTTKQNLQSVTSQVPFERKLASSYGLMLNWSPFYGKINTFNKIIYFDWTFAAGVGKIKTNSNALTVDITSQSDTFKGEDYTAGFLKTSFEIHATERITIGTSLLRTIYKAPGPTVDGVAGTDKWRGNSDFILSVGFSF